MGLFSKKKARKSGGFPFKAAAVFTTTLPHSKRKAVKKKKRTIW